MAGRVALVTGASEGIGRGLAVGLAGAGADLILCSRREEVLREVKAEIEALGRRAEVCRLDVTDLASIEAANAFCLAHFGKLDVLVNNAGWSAIREAWSITEDEFDTMLATGLKGVFFCSQILGGLMRERGYGKIINLSSTRAKTTSPGSSVYGALKAGVSHLTEALAVEWAPFGIRVNAIAPTVTPTPSRQAAADPERRAANVSRIPLGRLGTVEDLIPAAIYLASEASDFVTGQTLFVDGGYVARG